MGRRPRCSKDEGLNRGAWTALEDQILIDYIKTNGDGGWRSLPKKAGLKRCGKSCGLRWLNYLRPDIKRGNITPDEEELIIRLHKLLGNRWSLIAGRLPGRTDNEIKNYWNTNLGKKVQGHPTSTSTRIQQGPKQKKTSMTKPPIVVPPASPKVVSEAIRTKASRCTKVFLTEEPQKLEYLSRHAELAPSMVPDRSNPGEDNRPAAPHIDGPSTGELCLSDLLDSSQLYQFDNAQDGEGKTDLNANNLSPPSAQPFLFPEDMLDGWTGIDCVEPDIPSDLRSLTSFLYSEEDWLWQ